MTSSLIHRGDKYILRVFLKKTCKYRIKNNLPVFNDYRIPKELGIEIEQFIADTQDLRNMLKKPYPNVQRLFGKDGCHKKTSERELNSMKKQNEGVLAYQESKRQNTLSKIDEAYNYLKQTHQTITKTAISMESGVSIKTICKPYIRDHLSKYPEFSHTDKGDYKSPEEMAARIEVLEDRLSKSVNRNKELLAEIQKIRAESAIKYKQLQLDYERLAGAYQKETEKKIIRL